MSSEPGLASGLPRTDAMWFQRRSHALIRTKWGAGRSSTKLMEFAPGPTPATQFQVQRKRSRDRKESCQQMKERQMGERPRSTASSAQPWPRLSSLPSIHPIPSHPIRVHPLEMLSGSPLCRNKIKKAGRTKRSPP